MRAMIGRSVTLLVLALQLQPAVLPVLCDGTRAAQTADCDQPMSSTHDGFVLTGQQHHVSCLNPGFCGIAQTATPSSAIGSVSLTDDREPTELLRPSVHAIDAPAPLPPPPEA